MGNELIQYLKYSRKWQEDVTSAINRSHWSQDISRYYLTDSMQKDERFVRFFKSQILASLRYDGMENRHEIIAQAYTKTFEWIFKPPPAGERWNSFENWLTGSDSLYWITGKPGAGKSTLMKFLTDDERTLHHLKTWGGDSHAITTCSFYFWCSGTEIQMTQEGLLRTLLFEGLSQLPYLIPVVLAHRMEASILFGASALRDDWSWTELVQTFKLFLQAMKQRAPDLGYEYDRRPRKLVLFIDGLDEFAGKPNEIIEFVQSIVVTDVKICVSSRPWNAFKDAYQKSPSLRLEDLTSIDIRHYVHSKLEDHSGFLSLQQIEPVRASELMETVTTKAAGVFLWVYLVTESLLQGVSDGERLSELQNRLNDLPEDLEGLFLRMLNSLEPSRLARGSQYFYFLRCHIPEVSILQFSFADEDDLRYAFKLKVSPLTEDQRLARSDIMRRRLNACCKGLLEVRQDLKGTIFDHKASTTRFDDCPVEYLHRTVKDWLAKPDIWKQLLGNVDASFDPSYQLCCAYICYLKTMDPRRLDLGVLHDSVEKVLDYAQVTDPECLGHQVELLEELDRALTELTTIKDSEGKSFLDPLFDAWRAPTSILELSRVQRKRNTSFLHLATQKQLVNFVQHQLRATPSKKRTKLATSLLEVVVKYAWNTKLLTILLEHGADPNADGLLQLILTEEDKNLSDKLTAELTALLIRRGADPVVMSSSQCEMDNETRNYVVEARHKYEVELEQAHFLQNHKPKKSRLHRLSQSVSSAFQRKCKD